MYIIILIFLFISFSFFIMFNLKSNNIKVLYNINDFKKIKKINGTLENNYIIIKKEIQKLNNKRLSKIKINKGDIYFSGDKLAKEINKEDGWTLGYGNKDDWTQYPIIYKGEFFKNAKNNLPLLCSFLEQYKNCFYTLFISRMKPNSIIPLHSDGTKGRSVDNNSSEKERLTYHFYVDCPDDVIMYVKNPNNNKFLKIYHKNKESCIFDSEFYHEVANNSNEFRTIICAKFYIKASK
mgnify:CR=1 FL=1